MATSHKVPGCFGSRGLNGISSALLAEGNPREFQKEGPQLPQRCLVSTPTASWQLLLESSQQTLSHPVFHDPSLLCL